METPKKSRKLVEVEWEDSVHYNGWSNLNDTAAMLMKVPGGVLCRHVGYLLEDSKKRIVLVMGLNDEELDGMFVIPRQMVRSITVLREEV